MIFLMTVERDIAGFALPFAAAVTAAAYIRTATGAGHTAAASAALAAVCIIAYTLVSPYHNHLKDSTLRLMTALLGAAAGTFCAITGASVALSAGEGGRLTGYALDFGTGMQAAIDAIPFSKEMTGGVIKALITGERSGIPRGVTEAFRDSGASHILALSGLHLGIIYGILRRISGFTGNSPAATKARSCMIILVCGFYTMATGAGPSIVRAFIFITLGEAARLTGRYRSTGSILLAALLLQLVAAPMSARSAGFQLSYAAMAGIAFIYPWLNGLWREEAGDSHRFPVMRKIWNSVTMSISCQITTGPLAYMYFGTFPQYFLLTNLIALPLTGIIIPAALATLILSAAGICPDLAVTCTEWLVTLLVESLEIISVM